MSCGVGGGTRTPDSRIKSAVLCQLSYADAKNSIMHVKKVVRVLYEELHARSH